MEIDWKKLRKLIGDQILLERESALVKHIADEAERKSKEHRLELDVYLDECQAGTAGGADPIEELANGRGVPMAKAAPKLESEPRYCGSCKYCKPSDKGPDGVECTRTRTDILPIVRWSVACQDFEEASREMA